MMKDRDEECEWFVIVFRNSFCVCERVCERVCGVACKCVK